MQQIRSAKQIRIAVFLDPERNPPVWVEPGDVEISGPTEIIWEVAADSPIHDFYFLKESLNLINGAGFIGKRTHDHDKRYRVLDTFAYCGDSAYTLMVEFEKGHYATRSVQTFGHGGPCIRNK